MSEDLNDCYINVDFGLDQRAEDAFAALSRSFRSLCEAQKKWDITSTYKTDRVKERTTAVQAIARTETIFEFSDVDILRSNSKGLKFNNASGLEMYLFPGFILSKERGSDFALIEWSELSAEGKPSNFIESEPVPTDAQVISHTWAKANKDGSPDRRFTDNYQIPVVRYGELWFKSPGGLYEAYMVSSQSKVDDFIAAIQNLRTALSRVENARGEALAEEEVESPPQATAERKADIEKPPIYVFDLVISAILVLLLLIGIRWIVSHRSELVSSIRPAETASIQQPQLEEAQPAYPSVYVVPKMLNVRVSGSKSARVVQKVGRGVKLLKFRSAGAWTEVGTTSKPIGWALTQLLSAAPPTNPRANSERVR